MSDTPSNMPAFPVEVDNTQPDGRQTGSTTWQCYGMTLRDYFAAHALPGLLMRNWSDPTTGQVPANVQQQWAEGAYRVADEMLKARQK